MSKSINDAFNGAKQTIKKKKQLKSKAADVGANSHGPHHSLDCFFQRFMFIGISQMTVYSSNFLFCAILSIKSALIHFRLH